MAAALALSPLSAQAFEQTTANLAVTGGNVKQTQPSGLDVDYVIGGGIDGLTGTANLNSKGGTATTFTPVVDRATPTLQMDVPYPLTPSATCARPAKDATNYCTDRGTITVNFEHPTTDPVLHLAGLGGSAVQGTTTQRLIYSAALKPTGSTPAGTVLSGNNLEIDNGYIQAANSRASTQCNTTLTEASGVAVTGGSTAGCGSVRFAGTFSQLTFQVDMQTYCLTSGTTPNCTGVVINDTSNDQFVMVTTNNVDLGDAPATYQTAPAASHAVGNLRLGANAPDDDGGLNPTASPNAVAAGANANGTNGDGADEDAFTTLPDVISQGTAPYQLTVPISGTTKAGTVAGWIDFNRNGAFDTGERAAANFNAGATSVALSFTKAAGLTTGATYARLRTSFGTGLLTTANGRADSGEVEDYSLNIVNENASLTFVKSAGAVQDTNSDGINSAGDQVTYTFTVTNNGNVAASGVAITDPKIPSVSCTGTTLAVGASTTCTGTYTLTQADVNTGNVANTATVNATSSLGTAITRTASANRSVTQVTRASLTKSAGTLTDPDGNGPDVGDAIPYTFVVTNTGNVPLTAASVTDPKITGVTCPAGTLAPGASKTCSGTYTLTQADVNAGKVDNSATASVTSAAGTSTTPAATSTKTFTPSTTFTFDKQAAALNDNDGNGADVGDTIAYSFVFSNTGTATLNTPSVTDTKIGAVTCPTGTVEPGSTITCTKTYTLTQADVDSGAVNNSATGVLRNPAGTALATSAPDAVSTTLTPSNLLKLTKTAGAPNLGANNRADPGDTITYTFLFENIGATTLSNPVINDPKVGAVTCPTGSGGPGQTVTCTPKVYTITQADIDAGTVDNSATASGTTQGGATVTSAPSAVSTPLTRVNTFTFAKTAGSIVDANTSTRVDAGDTIQYTFTTVNTGNTTLTGLVVNDAKIGPVTCSPTTLAPGATVICTKTYTLTQTDVDSGAVNNTASATVTPPTGVAATSESRSTSTPIAAPAAMTLAKTPGTLTDPDANGPDVGDVLPYSFVVTNTGPATINGVTVSDTKLSASPLTCTPASIAPGGGAACGGSYTLTQADVDAGKVDNTATANGTRAGGGAVSANRTATKTFTPTSSFAFDKQVGAVVTGADGRADVGDAIPYTFVFTNTGATTLSAPSVTDTKIGPVTCPTGARLPGASVSCTKNYLLTQADIDSGTVNNNASATMSAPTGLTAPAGQSDSTSLPIAADNNLTLTKTAGAVATGADGRADVGDTITYTFVVSNQGNRTLTAVAVSDPKVGAVTCSPTTLAPGASVTCTKAYALTQADIDAGKVDNVASASGRAPGNVLVSSNSPTATRNVAADPRAVVDKQVGTYTDVNSNSRVDVGDTIAYGFVIQNTGNVTLDPITVNDAKIGAVTCPTGPLAPGVTRTCTPKTYTITQADVDSGTVNNSATVTAKPPVGPAFTSPADTTSTDTTNIRTLSVAKTAGAVNDLDANGTDVGDTVGYTLVATNTGTRTISGVTITDPKLPGLTCPATTLTAGQSLTCTGTYTLTQADVDAASVVNTATATGTDPGGTTITGTGGNTKTLVPTSSFTFGKSAGAIATGTDGRADVGDTITYTFSFTNTGTTTLKAPTVTDAKVGPVTCPTGAVAPGATVTCSKTYALTQADIDSGAVNNTATGAMTANNPGSPAPSPATRTDSTSSTVAAAGLLTLTKTAGAVAVGANGRADVGDTITYTFVVKNDSNRTLTDVAVSDPKVGAVTCSPTTLAPGASVTCTKAYALTQADIDAGTVVNTATATARNPQLGTVTSNTPEVSTTVTADARAVVDKQVGAYTDVNNDGRVDVGDTIAYGFVIENTGNVTLDPVTVNDAKIGAVTCPTGPLAPGVTRTCTPKTYTITQADVDSGSVANSATVTAKPPVGPAFTSPADTTSTDTTNVRTLSVVKTAGAVNDLDSNGTDVGDTVGYTITATNSGTRTISGVTITDPKLPGLTCPATTLTAAQSLTCTGTYTLTQADVDAGTVVNTATATGTDPAGGTVTATGGNTKTLVATSRFTFDKQAGTPTDADADGAVEAGDTIAYSFVLTNTGATTLTAPTVTDTRIGPVTCPPGAVAPGDAVTCSRTYTLTQTDVDSGAVNNTATGAMTPNVAGTPTPTPATRTDSTSSTLVPAGDLRLTKSAAAPADANDSGRLDAGDTILYTFTLTNRGNTTLSNAAVSDQRIGAVTCPPAPIAPGLSLVCSKTYTLSQSDLDAGSVQNTATASAVDTKGTTVPSGSSTVTSTLAAAPSVMIDKQAAAPLDLNSTSRVDAGDTIAYTFVLENDGNVTLDPVTVSDSKVGPVTCAGGALEPGDTRSCGPVTYTITQADADSGTVPNTATVTAVPPVGPAIIESDSTSTDTTQESDLSLTKTAGVVVDADTNGIDVGDTVPYTITVTNTGTKTISDIVTTDAKIPDLDCSTTTLAAGQSATCTGTYTLTQGDVDAGKVDNTATATGADPAGDPVTVSGSSTKTLVPVSRFDFDKQAGDPADANDSGRLDAGDTITYRFVFTNTGTTTLRSPAVTDVKVGPVSCATGAVAPAGSVTCTKVYELTQDDIDAGAVNNTATGSIDSPPGRPAPTPPTRTDATSSTLALTNTLQLTKTATGPADDNGNDRADRGELVTYSFAVENTGTQTLTLLSVQDQMLDDIACPTTTIAPGQTVTCEGTYPITQADIDAGGVENSASATASAPGGGTVPSNTSTITTDVTRVPDVTLDKQAAPAVDANDNGRIDAGDTIRYSFVIENTGNTSFEDSTVDDPKLGAITCPTGPVAPGAAVTCTPKVYTITQADVDSGAVANTADVTVTPAGLDPITSDPDVTSTPVVRSSTLQLTKTPGVPVDSDGNGPDVGDLLPYTFTVRNTGSTTLSDVAVTDAQISGSLTCTPTSITPGQSATCSGNHVLTQTEIDAGSVANTATATANGPVGPPATDTTTATKAVVPVSSFGFDKQAGSRSDVDGDGQASAGDTLAYTFVFTNTGATTLSAPVVDDPLLPDVTCRAGPVPPLGQVSCTDTYTLTQVDVDSGAVNNTARGSMTAPPNTPPPADKSASTSTEVPETNRLELLKTAGDPVDVDDDGLIGVGDTVTYTFRVTNTGNQTLSDVAIVDPAIGAVSCPTGDLPPLSDAPLNVVECSRVYALTQADVDLGGVVNTAEASALDPEGDPVLSEQSTVETDVEADGTLELDKQAGDLVDLDGNGPDRGDTIDYTFVIDNIGNVTVDGVTVTDTKIGPVTCPAGPLAPADEPRTCGPFTYVVTQADVDAGTVDNIADVTANDPTGEQVDATDSTSTPTVGGPDLTTVKEAGDLSDPDANGVDAGDVLSYDFTLTNSGTTSLTVVSVTDAKLGGTFPCSPTDLAPGGIATCSGGYTLTQADVDAGTVSNTATGSALDPDGDPVTSTTTIETPLTPTSSFELDKRAGPIALGADNRPSVGDTIAYTFVFTNTGGTTLSAPVVVDSLVGAVVCPSGPVEPTETVTCAPATPYALTQLDIDSGAVNNVATGTMTAPPGTPVPDVDTDDTSTPVAAVPSLTLTKTAGPVDSGADGRADVGDTIEYTFTVTNTGNRSLTDITVDDPLIDDVACDDTSLAPGDEATCTGTYAITQDDLDAGTISNTASATGIDADGAPVPSPEVTEETDLDRDDAAALDKSVSSVQDVNANGATDAGDRITYTFVLTNTGNTTLAVESISDPKVGALVCGSGPVEPGDQVSCAPKTYTVTSQDVLSGAVQNTAIATVVGPGAAPRSISDSTSTTTRSQPVARDDTSTGKQGQPQSVDPLANDSAGDAAVPLVRATVTLIDADDDPAATVTVTGGVYTIVDDRIVFTPDPTFTDTPAPVTYRVADTKGTEVTATYQPQITAVTPDALDDESTGLQGRPQTIDVLDNDVAGDDTAPLDPDTLQLLDADDEPVDFLVVPDVGRYDVVDGTIVFTPEPAFTGPAPAVGYQVADRNGTVADALIAVDVTAVTPVADDDPASTLQGRPVTIDVLGNDEPGNPLVPLDRDSPTLLDEDGDPVASVVIDGVGRYDVVDDAIVFTPDPAFSGPVPAVTYRVADVNGTTATAVVSTTVDAVAPEASDDESTDSQGRPQTVDPLDNDEAGDPDVALDPTTLTLVDAGGDPATTVAVTGGTYTLAGTTITFTPDPAYAGTPASVTYRVADVNGTTTTARYQPTVTPVTRPDSSGGLQGLPQSVDPLVNDDRDPTVVLDPLTLALVDPVTGQPTDTVTLVDQGTYTVDAGRITFAPVPAFSGTPTAIAYLVTDQTGAVLSDTYAPVVTSLTPGPSPDVASGPQGVPLSVEPLDNDNPGDPAVALDPDSLTLLDADGEPTDTVTVDGGVYTLDGLTITFTPDRTRVGPAPAVTYRVADVNGTTATSTFTPTLLAVTPDAVDDSTTGPQGVPQSVDVLDNDVPGDPDVALDPDSVTLLDANGVPTDTVAVAGGTYTLDGTTITFTPDRTFVDTAPAVRYRVADVNGTTDTASYRASFTRVSPAADPDATTGTQGAPQSVDPLANDDPGDPDVGFDAATLTLLDADGDPATTVVVEGGRYTLTGTTITFTPTPTYSGDPTPVRYRVVDENGTQVSSTYAPSVAPVTRPDESAGLQGADQSVDPLANDTLSPVELDAATLTLVDPVTGLTADEVEIAEQGTYRVVDGLIVFDPLPTFSGPATPIAYRVDDVDGNTLGDTYAPTVVSLTPGLDNDSTLGPQGVAQSVQPLLNDEPGDEDVPLDPTTLTLLDADGDPTDTVAVVGGVFTLVGTTITFTPDPDFVGSRTVTYRVADGNGTTATATYSATLSAVTPEALADSSTGRQGAVQSVDPLDNDLAGDDAVPLDPTSLTLLDEDDQPTDTVTVDGGVFTLDGAMITFTPDLDFVGSRTVTYRVADVNGTTATATYRAVVTAVTPIARVDVSTGRQGAVQFVDPLVNDEPGDEDVPLDPTSLTLLDADGEPTDTVTVAAGTYTLVAGVITFTPDPTATDTPTPVSYRVADANGTTATSRYAPTITAVTPEAADDESTGIQGATQSVNPLLNDEPGDEDVPLDADTLTLLDADGEPATIVEVIGGSYTITDGRIVFTPDPTFTGPAPAVTYEIRDENGTPDTAQYAPNVTAVTPEAADDESTGIQGATQSVNPLENDEPGDDRVPLDADTLTLLDGDGQPAATVEVEGGSYTITDGRIVFTPDPTFTGPAPAVTYEIRDANGTPDTATYAASVTAVTPEAVDDETTGIQGATQSVNPLLNDEPGDEDVPLDADTLTLLDADGDPATTVEVEGGSYTITDGRIVFTPDPTFTGPVPGVTYEIRDANGTPDTATYMPTVTAVTPEAADDETTGIQGATQSVNPLLNDEPGDEDVPLDADTLTLLDENGDPAATVEVEGGSYTITDGRIVFTPDPTFTGPAPAVTYEIRDANGTPDTATYTPTVTAVTPEAADDETTGIQGATQSVDPLLNDEPGDEDVPLDADTLTLLDENGDPAATVEVVGGSYTITDGRIVFTPDPTFTGPAPAVTYEIRDANGTPDTATYAATVTAVTPQPVNDTSTGRQGAQQSVDPLDNDEPGDDTVPLVPGSLTLLDADDEPTDTVEVVGGTYTLSGLTITFTPDPTFTGPAPAVTYRVADENGTTETATYRATVTDVVPTAEPDVSTGIQGATQSVDPLLNDEPGDVDVPLDPATLTLLDAGGDPADEVVVAAGTYTIVDGRIVFAPVKSYFGDPTPVRYSISDENGTTVSSSYQPSVTAVTPEAEPDTSTGIQGATQSVDPLANDEPGDDAVPLDPASLTLLDVGGNPATTVVVVGGSYTITDGRIVFTPTPAFTSTAPAVTYRVADENGTTDTSTYTPTVTPVTPTASPDSTVGLQGKTQSVDPLLNDEPGDEDVPLDATTLTLLDADGNATTTVEVAGGTYAIAGAQITFTPAPTFTGPAAPAVRYRVADENGTTATSTYTARVTAVTPIARDDSSTGRQGASQSVNPLTNDDPGNVTVPLVAASLTLLDADGVPATTVEVIGGSYTITGGRIVFTPAAGYSGTPGPVTYRVADVNGTTDTAQYAPAVAAVTPTAGNDSSTGKQGAVQSVDPLTNDAPGRDDVPLVPSTLTLLDADDDPADEVTVAAGTYTITDGRIVFTPVPTYSGVADAVTYRVADANGTTATALYTPTVTPVTPNARPDASSALQGASPSVDPLANDSAGDPDVPLVRSTLTLLDADGDPTDEVVVGAGTYAIVDGRIVFTPNAGFRGDPTPVRYAISDRNGTTVGSTYQPSITAVTPIARRDDLVGIPNRPIAVDPLANDSAGNPARPLVRATLTLLDGDGDGDGDPATTVTVDGGSYTIVGNQIVFTPDPDYTGTPEPVTYRVADSNGTTATSTFNPVVEDVQTVLNDDATSGAKGQTQSVNPLANDVFDAEHPVAPGTLTLLDAAGNPATTVTVDGGSYRITNGRIVFTPTASYSGTAPPVTYRVADVDGVQRTATYTPTVVPALPTATNDTSTGKQGAVQSVDPLANDTSGGPSAPFVVASLTLVDAAGNPVAAVEVEGGTYVVQDGRIVFTPEPGFVGAATPVRYRVTDTDGRSVTARYTPTVRAITPVAVNDRSTGPVGEPQSVDPLANDRSGDTTVPLDPTTLTLLSAAGVPVGSVDVEGGTYTIVDGRIVFTPEPGFVGQATPVRYQVADENGTLAVARYTPTVDDGAIVEDITKKAPRGTTVVFDPVARTPDLDPTSVRLIDPETGDEVTRVEVDGQGVWTVDPDTGEITFTPVAGLVGDPTPVRYVGDTSDDTPVRGDLTVDYPTASTPTPTPTPTGGTGTDGSGTGGSGTDIGGSGTGLSPGSGSGTGSNGIRLLPGTGVGDLVVPIGILGLLLVAAGVAVVRRRADEA